MMENKEPNGFIILICLQSKFNHFVLALRWADSAPGRAITVHFQIRLRKYERAKIHV
jgi:hypothetical protein